MNAEIIVSTLLSDSTVAAQVGTRRALGQLPQNTAMPAIVYQIVDGIPAPYLNYSASNLAQARVQINVLAASIVQVKSIHAIVRAVMDFRHNTLVANKRVMSCRFALLGPMEKDNDAGIWIQPADYLLQYYE